MNGKWIRKEVIMAISVLPWKTKENRQSLVQLPSNLAKLGNGSLSDTNVECYSYTSLLAQCLEYSSFSSYVFKCMDVPGSIPGRGREFLSGSGATQPPVQW